jgi:hypothetical protein
MTQAFTWDASSSAELACKVNSSFTIGPAIPNHCFSFCNADQKPVGHFDFNGDQLVFTGNADEAAKVFIDFAFGYFRDRLKAEYERGYDDALGVK